MDISYSRQKSVMIIGSTSTVNKLTEKKLHLPISLLQSPLTNENCSGQSMEYCTSKAHYLRASPVLCIIIYCPPFVLPRILVSIRYIFWNLQAKYLFPTSKKKIMPSDIFWDLSRTFLLFALANTECFSRCVWKWLIDDILVCYCWNCFYMETWYLG